MDSLRPFVKDKKRSKEPSAAHRTDELSCTWSQATCTNPETGALDSKVWQDVTKGAYKDDQVTGSDPQLYQNTLWRDCVQDEKASKVSAPPAPPPPEHHRLGFDWENYSDLQTDEAPDVDVGTPWCYWRRNSTVNRNTGRIDTLKSFWVDYDAACAEMNKLRILAEQNKFVDYPDQEPKPSFWQAFSTTEPSSPVSPSRNPTPATRIMSPDQDKLDEYPRVSDNEIQISFDSIESFVSAEVQKEEKGSHPMSHQDKAITLDDEAFTCQDIKDTVDTISVKEEACIMIDTQEQEANLNNDKPENDLIANDIQEPDADIQPINLANVAQTPNEITLKLSDMIEPVLPKLKLSDLVEVPPEGSTVKLTDLIHPPKRIERLRRW